MMRQFLDSLGWAVLHAVWQVALVFLVVWVWRAVVRRRSPALAHGGTMLGLVACLGAFLMTFAVTLIETKTGGTFAASGATLAAESPDIGVRALTGWIAPFAPGEGVSGAALDLTRITPVLACLWALGFAVMSLRYAFSFGQAQQLRVLGITEPDAKWTARFTALLRDTGVSQNVRLLISANVSDPITLGLFKPVVLVPIGFLTGLPSDQVEAVLRHELAHIRRYDYALNLVQTGIKTVLFFHPAIHIMSRWAEQDREQACDDLAVREGRDPLALVRGLAALRLQTTTPAFAMGAAGTGEQSPLMARLTRLSGQTPKRGRPEHLVMSGLSALLIGAVYMGASLRAEAHPHPIPKPAPAPLPASVQLAPPAPPAEPNIPDTVISFGEDGVKIKTRDAVPYPTPPAPPAMPPLTPETLMSEGAMQSVIATDKAIWKSFSTAIGQYETSMKAYVKSQALSEDAREDMLESLEDYREDMEDMFEDRREAIEDSYEALREAREDLDEDAAESHAELVEQIIEERIEQEVLRHTERVVAEAERIAETVIRDAETRVYPLTEQAKRQAELAEMRRKIAKENGERARKNAALARNRANTQVKADAKAAREAAAEARKHAALARAEAKAIAKDARKQAKYARKQTRVDAESRRLHEGFRDIVMRELLADGLIDSTRANVHLSHPNNVMSLNGKPIGKGLRGKYCELMNAHGLDDNNTEVKITPDSLKILTDWNGERHKTSITYGTWSN